LFFYLSKFAWVLLSPANLLYLLLLAGTVLLFLQKQRPAKLLIGSSVVLLSLAAFLPIGKWIGTPLETRFTTNPQLPDTVDGIILLGGAADPLNSYIWDQAELGSAAERYLAFVTLAKDHPAAKLVFTGGSGSIIDQAYREADIALYLLESLGLDRRRLELERDSRNTWENVVNSKALMQPAAGETWVLVTSAAHMPRAIGVFCAQDWPLIPYPVDHETSPGTQLRIGLDLAGNLSALNDSTREWLGLLVYRLTGKTAALFPAGC
jgi:uncharacterized SAM-binding protein YcdF (DUF218 family)